MVYRTSMPAPESSVADDRRGRRVGIFCLACGSVYALHKRRHTGKPVYGKDHIASTCPHEGDDFAPGESWWEPGVEVLPAPAEPPTGPETAKA